ncbi:hypothetical protein [Catalinimonas niigatensis]|uniref:hypothetical protein n=1 Tax=Catalinimonas niigatensis TaxID=1397264 RepID=UPI0026660390|nr:hypothetical protein [Catalinimonas niigatensis]WPP51998.1 hypothetical protein PZB72_06320 [Catalinimonas niigatensis]
MLPADNILIYYRLRFNIEFLFRDASLIGEPTASELKPLPKHERNTVGFPLSGCHDEFESLLARKPFAGENHFLFAKYQN